MQMIDGFPRRNRVDLATPAEAAIRKAMHEVEIAGCDILLTDAVILLDQAREKVADFVELPCPACEGTGCTEHGFRDCASCGGTGTKAALSGVPAATDAGEEATDAENSR